MHYLTRIKILTFITLVLLFTLITGYLLNDRNARVDQLLQQQIANLENNYAVNSNLYELSSSSLFNNVIRKPELLELIYQAKKHRDDPARLKAYRDAVYAILRPYFEGLNRVGMNIMMLTFEDNIVFLRVHRPGRFNDNVAAVRHGVAFVNADRQLRRGFEQGKISHAFRNIFPLFYKGEYLGNIDLSYSSEAMQESMTALHGIDTHFILQKKLFDVKIWQSEKQVKYIQSIEHDDYLFALTPHQKDGAFSELKRSAVTALKKEISQNIQTGKAFSLYHRYQDDAVIVTFFPIVNIKAGERVAYLVSYTKSYYLNGIVRDFIINSLVIGVGFIILGWTLYSNIRRRYILQEEVEAKTRDLKLLNEHLQDEVQKQLSEIRNKDKLLIEQSRMASMGEMIGNIAHQWRQPLNALSLILQKLPRLHERDALDAETLSKNIKKGVSLIDQMSVTIDDFRNFLVPSASMERFSVGRSINTSFSLVVGLLEASNIRVKSSVDPNAKTYGCHNELTQVIVNILNNAKDAIIDNQITNGQIDLQAKVEDGKVLIYITDNAGGIPEKVISKIFDPYFSTKEDGKGTGIGLFMSKRIIEEKMHGQLSAVNVDSGACFIITLPLS